MVASAAGPMFLKTFDYDHATKDEFVAKLFMEVVEKIGDYNIVQLIIDNTSNYKAACALIKRHFIVSLDNDIRRVASLQCQQQDIENEEQKQKDPIGIENRYFDLLLVPISVCVFATMLELKNPDSGFPRLGRAIGLILHGMWFVQMGISFFSDLIVHGCSLHEKSRGNFTIRCKGHPEYHRGKAIATLQFNCHLALLVAFTVGAYAVVCKKHGVRKESMRYKPIGAEMLQMDSTAQFTLDSDDEGDEIENRIKDERRVPMHKALTVVQDVGANGYGSHR
ncbi:hypothetical protein AgCh_008022 [Apium graveolens]